MEWGAIANILVNVAVSVLSVTGLPLIPKIKAWVEAHTQGAAAKTALAVVENLVRATVADLGTTVIPQFQAKIATGTLTTADIASLTDQALARLKTMYGQDGLATLASAVQLNGNSVEQFLASQIKLAVVQLQKPATAPVTVAVTPPTTPAAIPAIAKATT